MNKFNEKLRWLFIVVVFISLVFFGKGVKAEVIFEENWDGEPPTNGFPNVRGVSWNGWETGDYGGWEAGYSELSTEVYHSAPRSLHQLKAANEYSVPDQIRNFDPVNEIRIRFYVYFDANYANIGSTGVSDYIHFMFLQTARSYSGVRMDIRPSVSKTVCGDCTPNPPYTYSWNMPPNPPPNYPTCIDRTKGFFAIASPGGYGETYYGVTRGHPDLCFGITDNLERWILVEWAYKIIDENEGRASLWIDGVELMKDELLPPDPGYMDINRLFISGYMSTGRNYDVGFYIDDIVVTDDYDSEIGPVDGEEQICQEDQIPSSGCLCMGNNGNLKTFYRGLCCNGIWFDDKTYTQCPTGNFYYVDQNNPQASDSNPGTENLPWLTAWHAVHQLQAGNTLFIKDGYYYHDASGENSAGKIGTISPTASGTQDNPITIRNYPGNTPTIGGGQQGCSADEMTNAAIGDGYPYTANHDWIVIDGLNVHGEIWIDGSSYWTIQNSDISEGASLSFDTLIRMEHCNDMTIRNNIIHDNKGTVNGDPNGPTIMNYYNSDILIEHNEFYNTGDHGAAIFLKVEPRNYTIRYNYFHDCPNTGVRGPGRNKGTNIEVYQNIFTNCYYGVRISSFLEDLNIYNNVFYNNQFDIRNNGAPDEVRIYNNIFANPTVKTLACDDEFYLTTAIIYDYNCYTSDCIWDVNWATVATSLSDWQNYGDYNFDTNSLETNPQFVNPDNNDFHLQAGSTCRGRGLNGVNIGAYPNSNDEQCLIIGPEPEGYVCGEEPQCTDSDNDNYYAESGCGTEIDCDDENQYIYPNNQNNYCDCDSSDAYAQGITEICGDGIDHDCDGADATCPTTTCQEGYNDQECLCNGVLLNNKHCCYNGVTWRTQDIVCEEYIIREADFREGNLIGDYGFTSTASDNNNCNEEYGQGDLKLDSSDYHPFGDDSYTSSVEWCNGFSSGSTRGSIVADADWGQHVFVRYYLKFDEDFIFYDDYKKQTIIHRDSEPHLYAITSHPSKHTPYDPTRTELIVGMPSTQGHAHANIETDGVTKIPGSLIGTESKAVWLTRGRWYYIEVEWDTSVPGGRYRIWVDGVKRFDYTGGDCRCGPDNLYVDATELQGGNIDDLEFYSAYNGWDGTGPNQFEYIDEIVVSNHRIGPLAKESPTCTDSDLDNYYKESNCGTEIDCNDTNSSIHPNAVEICGDEIDQDCDGSDLACTYHQADLNQDNCINLTELYAFIDIWKNNKATIGELMETIGLWRGGCK